MDLSRFTKAQEQDFKTAFKEIKNGRKMSHWMWYIFPQIQGLGKSSTSQYYGIKDLNEARAFINDPYLGENLKKISMALLELEENNAVAIFGKPDDIKLKSCMTLFSCISEDGSIFHKVLEKYFDGRQCKRTLSIIGLNK
nr:DUF1810 domain-containing protein [uncultured Lachnoanaerobaculum sp.]